VDLDADTEGLHPYMERKIYFCLFLHINPSEVKAPVLNNDGMGDRKSRHSILPAQTMIGIFEMICFIMPFV